jgi:predicted Rdx family selenoprotein
MATTKHSRSVGFCRALCALMILVSLASSPYTHTFANDIQITNLTVHPHSGGNGEVEFDITWSNSWRVNCSGRAVQLGCQRGCSVRSVETVVTGRT